MTAEVVAPRVNLSSLFPRISSPRQTSFDYFLFRFYMKMAAVRTYFNSGKRDISIGPFSSGRRERAQSSACFRYFVFRNEPNYGATVGLKTGHYKTK